MNRLALPFLALAAAFEIGLGVPTQSAYAKSVFDADPSQRGLLIFDVRLRHKTLLQQAEADMRRGVVVKVGEPATDLVGGDPTSDVLVFALEPGQWRLAGALASLRLGRTTMSFDLRFPADSLPDLTQRAEIGTVVYVGRVEAKSVPHLLGRDEIHYSVSYDREREIKILKKLQGKAKKSAWADKIAARLAGLEAGAGASTPSDSTTR